MNIQEAFNAAYAHHRAGRLSEAETLYRQVLASSPNQPETLHLLGVIHWSNRRFDSAAQLIQRALEIKADWPDAWYNLGNVQKDTGQRDHAIASYRRAISLNPQFADAFNNLGNLLIEKQEFDQAISCFQNATSLQPDNAIALNNLGNSYMGKTEFNSALIAYQKAVSLRPEYVEAISNLGIAQKQTGDLEKAEQSHRRAIALRPDFAEAYCRLGDVLNLKGQSDEALELYLHAGELKPDYVDAFNNAALLLREKARLPEAITAYKKAIAIRRDNAELYTNLGNVLKEAGNLPGAIVAHRKAIEINPKLAEAYSNLGLTLKNASLMEEAIEACRKAIALKPTLASALTNLSHALLTAGDVPGALAAHRAFLKLEPNNSAAHSSFIFSLHYYPQFSFDDIAKEHADWDQAHAQPLAREVKPHRNRPEPDRRIRIGYVSPDFNRHPVARFMTPVFENYNRAQFETFCYANVYKPDEITDQLKSLVENWRDISRMSDEDAADLIRKDLIDILVDLAGHTARNRLLIFARKPAPVQVSYLGYPGSTGLTAIDYRLTDNLADPADQAQPGLAEKVIRLPDTNWCYTEQEMLPEAVVSDRSFITFGSFNSFVKITPQMLKLWATILQRVPGSKLLIKASPFNVPGVADNVRKFFNEQQIDSDRLNLIAQKPDLLEHMLTYHQMDIALDTFPYHGTTTTCEALWMGVPVVTLAGHQHVSRVGVSLLTGIGLCDLVTNSEGQYVQTAVDLANDRLRLNNLHLSLRDRMKTSAITDGRRFTGNLESAFKWMWRQWCENPTLKSNGQPNR